MKDLIEALTIFASYQNEDPYSPTHCEHDVLMVVGVPQEAVAPDDVLRLDKLGFFWSTEYDCWASFRFGSA